MVDQAVSNRLRSKTVEQSIITNIARDFNLTPLLAEAYFNQIRTYFLEHADLQLSSGQLSYLAIDEQEPAGKPISLCKKVSVKLSVHVPDEDLTVYKTSGLRGLRQHKLLRITKEAIEQGAVLSYEDIAFILTTSVITVKRDMSAMRRQGIVLPTRGWRHDTGRGQTHKTQILALYLAGHQFSDIERRTKHSQSAIQRYIQDFAKVVLLHQKGFSIDQIRISVGFSHRLIDEYLQLFKEHQNRPALKRILQIAQKKRKKTS